MRVLLVILAVLAWGPCASAKPVPIDVLAESPTISSPILSPDGRRLAALTLVDDEIRVALIDPANIRHRKTFSFGDTHLTDIQWAGNSRLLATSMGLTVAYGIPVPVMRLIILDVDTGATRIADPTSKGLMVGEVLFADPTGRWALVASQTSVFDYPSVRRVDLASGQAVTIEKPRTDVWDWYADDDGVLRGGIAIEGRRWTLWYRDHAAEPLRKLKGKFEKDDDGTVDQVIFGRAKTAIITNQKTGRFALYEYDLKSAAVGRPIFEHPTVDIDSIQRDSATGEINGIRYQDDRWRTHWLDPAMAKLQANLDKALPNMDNKVVSKSDDGNKVLVWSASATDPGAYYLLDRKAKTMSPVVVPLDRVDPNALAKVKPTSYEARDKLAIPAYLTLPTSGRTTNLPLILMPHGGPFARDEWVYDPLVQLFASRGYAVFQPQFRGSTGYGRQFVERGYGEWGRKMQDDLDDGIAHLAQEGVIDPKRVCIVGWSYGGYAALWGAVRNPAQYRCAASVAGISDLGQQLKANRKSFSATRYFREWRTKVQGLPNFDLKTVSPLTHAERLTVPVFIAHGDNDDTVLATQSRQMVQALTRARANVTSAFYKGADHDIDTTEDRTDLYRKLEAFVARYNPADAEPAPAAP